MNLSIVLLLAIANKAVVDYLVRPFKKLFPSEKAQLIISIVTPYISFASGFFIAYMAGVDAFAKFLPDAPHWLSLGLTSALVGGGASLIYDIVKSLKEWSDKVGQITPVEPAPPVIGD